VGLMAAEEPTQTVLSPILQAGAIGAMLIVMMYAAWKLIQMIQERANASIQREQERGDRLEKELSEKNHELQETVKLVFPTITQMTDLIKVTVDKNSQMQAIIELYQRQGSK
jgi:hypothetical protein